MRTLIFDTETTDLIKNRLQPLDRQPQIIEFFGLSVDMYGHECNAHHFFFKPTVKVTQEITNITGINEEMLRDAPPFRNHAQDIIDIIKQHDEVVAHNLAFDKAVVDFELLRCDLKVEWPELICTVEATEHMKGHRMKLNDLHEFLFGEGFTGAHRAENDVRALANCFRELRHLGVV